MFKSVEGTEVCGGIEAAEEDKGVAKDVECGEECEEEGEVT